MYLLPAPFVKKSHILAEIYFIFQKKRPRLDLKGFEYQIWTLKNDQKNSYQVRQILAIFCRLVARRVTKIVKKIKFEGNRDEFRVAEKLFPKTIIDKIFETNSSFHVK